MNNTNHTKPGCTKWYSRQVNNVQWHPSRCSSHKSDDKPCQDRTLITINGTYMFLNIYSVTVNQVMMATITLTHPLGNTRSLAILVHWPSFKHQLCIKTTMIGSTTSGISYQLRGILHMQQIHLSLINCIIQDQSVHMCRRVSFKVGT